MTVPDTSVFAMKGTSAERIDANGKVGALQGRSRNWE